MQGECFLVRLVSGADSRSEAGKVLGEKLVEEYLEVCQM
jgi:hypothetical protein